MKHIKLFNDETTYNEWITSDTYIAPYVSKTGNKVKYGKYQYDAELEYLESSGTQWIDTCIIPTITTVSQIKVFHISGNAVMYGYVPTGEDADNRDYRLFINFRHLYFDAQNKRIQVTNGGYNDQIYELELGNHYIKDLVNNTILVSGGKYNTNPEYTIKLNYTNDSNMSSNRWYYIKIFDNDTLLLDLIPVRKDGIGYMYDNVSKKLFANKGTGDFILGPDK